MFFIATHDPSQQAHALTALLTTPPDTPEHPEYPFITLLISGGHTLLILATSPTSFKILAGDKTDMSIGRAFDKTTRLLGIPWGARGPGASLEAYVREHAAEDLPAIEPPLTVSLPRQLFLGFAGLFSQVDRFVLARGGVLEEQERRALARAFQDVAIRQLEEKLLLALRWCDGEGTRVRHVVVSGGVASNALLRER
jgi:N6-L-threonylcarbamoyladenine synthase